MKVVEKIRAHFMFNNFLFLSLLLFYFYLFFNSAVYEICWKMLESGLVDRWQYGVFALHAGYLRLQIHTHILINIAFQLQQWLHERATMLRSTYLVCLCYVLEFMKARTSAIDYFNVSHSGSVIK
jgi:hypothetical protein